MKNIIATIGIMLLSLKAFSQTVTTSPATFGPTQEVTITVDISGTLLDGIDETEPLYLWGFINGCCGSPTNGEWTNSNEANRMTRVGPNRWSFTMSSLRIFMNQPPAAFARFGNKFGFLLKAKSGAERGGTGGELKTRDLEISVSAPVFSPTAFRTFPSNFTENDVVTVFYDQKLELNTAMKSLTEVFLYATAELNDGTTKEVVPAANVGTTPRLRLRAEENGVFSLTFVPRTFFALSDNQNITKINFLLRSGANATINAGNRERLPFIGR